jgi:DNA-binding MarR family transcriptional regulator
LYKQNDYALEYSTSNRRLRALEEMGYVARVEGVANVARRGRRKIHYGLTLKGSIAALLLEPTLSEKEFVTLLANYETVNHTYRLFRSLLSLGLPAKSVWSVFAKQLQEALEKGRVNLSAGDKVIEVLIVFELIKSIGEPMKEVPGRSQEIIEAVFDFVRSCPFESFFGNMTVVMLGAIAQRYLETNSAYRQLFRQMDGETRYTFRPLDDEKALKVLPFLHPKYSRIANETWMAFRDLSSFVYTMYDEYGEA